MRNILFILITLGITCVSFGEDVTDEDKPSFPPAFDKTQLDNIRRTYSALDSVEEFKPATAPVVGAFGFNLGDVFDFEDSNAGAVRVRDTDLICYMLQAPKPVKQFSHYAIWVTESTSKIYMIMGMGFYDEEKDASRRFMIMSEALGKKYGPKPVGIRQFWIHTKKMVMNGTPEPQDGRWEHYVIYIDLAVELDGQIEKEVEEIDLDAL